MAATGTVLTNKYSEGYPHKRYYGGNAVVDDIEDIARNRVCALFGADHANVQPHSGANANVAVYLALLDAGDTVLGMSLDHGGHLTHGSPVNLSGRFYNFVGYGLTESDERIDYEAVRALAHEHQPKMIVAGATAYPRQIDPKIFREIADEVGALFMFDAAHIAGLIAGGVHPNPVPEADIVTFTTHKTLRGPRGGTILCREEHAKAIDKAIFPGLQGGPLMHVIAAKAVAFKEALDPSFKVYQQQVVKNAQIVAEKERPRVDVWFGGTADPHFQAAEQGLLAEYKSPQLSQLYPWAQDAAKASGYKTVGLYSEVLGIAYNTEILAKKKLAAPKCWKDLANPAYRGEVQMANAQSSGTSYVAIATFVQIMGEEAAFKFMQAMNANVSAYSRQGLGPIKAVAKGESALSVSFLHRKQS